VVFAVTTRLIYFVKRFSTTIPIVGVTADPIATGLTLSLAKPSGNVTGVTDTGWEIMGKRFEILKELLPNARRIDIFGKPRSPTI
jgi:putative ABC transport system substrate-binding protein